MFLAGTEQLWDQTGQKPLPTIMFVCDFNTFWYFTEEIKEVWLNLKRDKMEPRKCKTKNKDSDKLEKKTILS